MMKIQIHTVHVTLGRFFLDQNLKTKKAEIIEVGFVPGFCKLCPLMSVVLSKTMICGYNLVPIFILVNAVIC